MRIAIDTLGTRGDVQPYLALARGLAANGHAVQLAAPEQFASLAHDHEVAFAPLPGAFLELLDTPEGKAAVAGGHGFSAGFKILKHVRPMMRQLFDAEWDAANSFEPDVVVFHPKALAAPYIAEKLGRQSVLASPLPGFTPTSDFPSPMLPFASLGPLNRVSHTLVIESSRLLFAKLLGEWRSTTLGLGRSGSAAPSTATIYAYSPLVVPRPTDWGRDVLVSGYWWLDGAGWKPDAALSTFLRGGPPPVYVGFGSMPGVDADYLTNVVVDALERAGKRGLLATGGGAITRKAVAPHIHVISGAPHGALFPLMDAIVHHGGAGTTAAAIRAGKPMAICPFFGDQRAASLGIAPPPLNRKTLTAVALAQAIDAMGITRMREAAAILGAKIRAEHGVTAAVKFIEDVSRVR